MHNSEIYFWINIEYEPFIAYLHFKLASEILKYGYRMILTKMSS